MVLNGGDILFRLLLLWGIFLPLGARWSLDARLRAGDATDGRSWVASVATAGLLVQVLFVYLTNAVHKAAGDAWVNGDAVAYVLSLDQFTILLGDTLAEYHLLLRVLTHAWFVLLLAAPLLVVTVGRVRTALAAAFVGMHLGMAVTMRLGLFPAVMVAALVPFFGTAVWDAVLGRLARTAVGQHVDRWTARLDERLPGRPTTAGTDGGSDQRRVADRDRLAAAQAAVATAVPLVVLVVVVLANVAAVGLPVVPEEAEPAVDATGLDQHWRMFAPDPRGADGWYVVPGRLTDGSSADAFHGGPVEWDRPGELEDAYPTARWRKYLSNVRWSGNTNHRSYLAAYLCGRWNRTHESDVVTVSVYYMEQQSRPFAASEPIERRHLHDHDCSGPLRQ
jgi:hypothetical protein